MGVLTSFLVLYLRSSSLSSVLSLAAALQSKNYLSLRVHVYSRRVCKGCLLMAINPAVHLLHSLIGPYCYYGVVFVANKVCY